MAIKDRLRALGKEAAGLAREVYDEVSEGAKKAHRGVKARGGYRKVLREELEAVGRGARVTRDSVRDTFFTDGRFDPKKTKAYLEERVEDAGNVGRKAMKDLTELTGKGIDAAQKGYRELVPSDEELKTTYAGIGSEYTGVLFRHHYDECLEFHDTANKILPKNQKGRKDILKDIKASASGDADELLAHYDARNTGGKTVPEYVTTAVRKYLSSEKAA